MNWLKKAVLPLCLVSGLASAEVAVIVHPSNNATLDQAEITRLFTGRGAAFSSGAKATPLNLADSAPARGEFDSKVLGKSSSQMKAYWSKLVFTGKGTPPKELGSDAEIVDLVSQNPNVIGYIDKASVTDKVKVLATF